MKKRNRILVGLAVVAGLAVGLVVAAWLDLTPGMSARTTTPATDSAAAGGPLTAQTFREIAKAQMPVVVNIRTESLQQTRSLTDFFSNDLLERFFGFGQPPRQPRDQITEAAGSGFIIDNAGVILTNDHVVADATRITVALYATEQGKEYDARVVGRDPLTDSALIELTEKPDHELPTAKLGQSGHVQPGDWVVAIGNPFNLAHTVTVGVISAVDRPFPVSEGRWRDVLQTDAAINPGNSGGPLLNLRGEVIGINTAIVSRGVAAGNVGVGVGFAIPIDTVRELLPELRRGTITRGRIGVQITPVTRDLAEPLGLKEARGALVRTVERGGPAAEAGVQPGDVIVEYNDKSVEKSDHLVEMVIRTAPGTTVPIEVIRDGQRKTLRVTVGTLALEEIEGRRGGPADTGFGMSLRDLESPMRRRLDLPAGRDGALVVEVQQGRAAARAGIRAGDVILEVNWTSVGSASQAAAAFRRIEESDTVFALLWRRGQELFVTMTRD